MKTVRSMVLVSNDPLSQARGAQAVYQRLEQEIAAHGLTDEISLMTVDDVGRHDTVPMVIIYPEA
ncbi:MAG TPA: (2Fe-2S) ferredoxin domain-containing protein, partial [Anaerolineae bacterium]